MAAIAFIAEAIPGECNFCMEQIHSESVRTGSDSAECTWTPHSLCGVHTDL
jgi:hypothetical protein